MTEKSHGHNCDDGNVTLHVIRDNDGRCQQQAGNDRQLASDVRAAGPLDQIVRKPAPDENANRCSDIGQYREKSDLQPFHVPFGGKIAGKPSQKENLRGVSGKLTDTRAKDLALSNQATHIAP